MEKFNDFSRPLSVFQVLFKANLIFMDFARHPVYSSTFQACANPVLPNFYPSHMTPVTMMHFQAEVENCVAPNQLTSEKRADLDLLCFQNRIFSVFRTGYIPV